MNSRFLLYMAFFLVLFMIYTEWQREQNPNMVLNQNQDNAENTLSPDDFPEQGVISESKKSTIFLSSGIPLCFKFSYLINKKFFLKF